MKALRRTRARGFTLVELTVSLVAGLIVAMAVVTLARSATNNFYEAVRVSATEQAVRVASERLRGDIARAGFMTTGNIKLADKSLGFSTAGHWVAPSTIVGTGSVAKLASIAVFPDGSKSKLSGAKALSKSNSFTPDRIEMTGNFTTSDSYRGRLEGACADGQRLLLNSSADAAMWRLIANAASADTAVKQAFRPTGKNGLARIVDQTGCQHYVQVVSAGMKAASTTEAEVCVVDGQGNKPAVKEPVGSCGAFDGTEVTINPVQRVNWYVGLNADATLNGEADVAGTNFNLYRQFYFVEDNVDKPGPAEMVAEKVVDLKFGLVVDDATVATRVGVYDYYTGKDNDIARWSGVKPDDGTIDLPAAQNTPSPHRVRAVRYRLVTRAALPDRRAPFSDQTPPFQSRYCMEEVDDYQTCKSLARVRVLTSEVALTNQARMSY